MSNKAPLVAVSTFRRIIPQILACIAKSLILVDIGLALGFSTIAIAALQTDDDRDNPVADDERTLRFDKDQASWFASLLYISMPVGSIISGWLTDRLGRKRAMMLVNIPHLVSWLLIYWASTVPEMYTAAVVLGIGIGIMETPVVTYIGEIW